METSGKSRTTRHGVQTAQEIRFWMSTPPITIGADAPISEVLAVMHEHEIRRLPVVDDDGKLRGIITDGDIRGADVLRATGLDLREIASALRRTTVYDVMTEQPIAVTPETTLREAALLMLDNKIGGLPVVNEQHVVMGMITESDLFEALVCYIDCASIAI
ncbi:MAG TPA: CBS domain-containing protein [Herpetosiphonaceae bacterium]